MQGFKGPHGLKFSKTLRRMGVDVKETPLARIFHPRDSIRYKGWRAKVLKKNGGLCFICNSREATQAHHMAMFSQNPDLRYDVENGQPVCFKCHLKTHSYGGLKEDKEPASEPASEPDSPPAGEPDATG